MNWYLNAFLTSWRDAINKEYPKRKRNSDGTLGDQRHQASISEHNPDKDGSVDAYDMDVNLYGSGLDTGSEAELAAIEKLKKEFQQLPGAQLWIHRGKIANKDIGNWKRRDYSGINSHHHHVHWQSDPDAEKRAGNIDFDDVRPATTRTDMIAVAVTIPTWPLKTGDSFCEPTTKYSATVFKAQSRLKVRGWKITVDGRYGPQTISVIRKFQAEKGLTVDGCLGPKTWRALWLTPVTD